MKVGVLGSKGKMGQKVMAQLIAHNIEFCELSFDKDSLRQEQVGLDGIIEFSSPSGLETLLEVATVPCVLASTGLSEDLKEKILSKSQMLPIFYSANYSVGLNQLISFLKYLNLDPNCLEIFETHHVHKKDAPSGTALMLQKELNILRPIVSIREGEVFGEHEIHYQMDGEKLVFKHIAQNRDLFAKGALLALKFLVDKDPGLYSMGDLTRYCGDSIKS